MERHFGSAREFAAYLNDNLDAGCRELEYVVRPGQAVHPADRGMTAESLGVSEASFDMNNRVVEWAGCSTQGDSNIGMQRFEGDGLPVESYQERLEQFILPEACEGFSDTDTIVHVIWRDDDGILWNVGPNSRDYEEIRALPVEEQIRLGKEIASLVGGSVVAHVC